MNDISEESLQLMAEQNEKLILGLSKTMNKKG
jgi:hypothetical protein